MTVMPLSDDLHAIPRLVGDAVEQLGKLVQNEANLARAEVSQKIARGGMGATFVVCAAVLAIPVLVLLLIAFAIWLTQVGISPVTAHVLSAACGGVVSVILAVIGLSYLKSEALKPETTLQQLKRDVIAAKEMAR